MPTKYIQSVIGIAYWRIVVCAFWLRAVRNFSQINRLQLKTGHKDFSSMPRRSWHVIVLSVTCWLALLLPCGDAVKADPCCPGANIITPQGCSGLELNSTAGRRFTLLKCEHGRFMMNPKTDVMDNFTITPEGELTINSGGDDYVTMERGRFCLSYMQTGPDLDPVALVCFMPSDIKVVKYMTTAILTVLSIGFLLLTIAVYVIVKELRDIQGKCIICTCSSLAMGFFFLAIANLSRINIPGLCTANGYMMYYWILSSFFWMNILSINIWKSVVFWNVLISELKQILAFVVYGWGVPLLLLIVAVITNHVDGNHIKPGFGIDSCWFKGKVATWTYFYGPIAVLLSINMILFVWTSKNLWNETNYSSLTKVKSLKFKFFLYLKVFFVMGIAWIFELISYIHGDDGFALWVIMDIFNCLQGLFLFLVLVLFRKKAMRGLHERGLLCGIMASRWVVGPDEECEEIVEAMVDNDPAATPMNS